jgi:hypothetical protein
VNGSRALNVFRDIRALDRCSSDIVVVMHAGGIRFPLEAAQDSNGAHRSIQVRACYLRP